MKHIFVVDDERNIRELIEKYLIKEGYKVTTFFDGNNIVAELPRLKPDLIVLDIMMPGIDGLELCKNIRKETDIPIIFVSAKDDEIDRIVGLELGADDYLSKPFSPRELMIRIKNIFKRLDKMTSGDDKVIDIKDLKLYQNRRYLEKDGEVISLTTKEYELIEYLMINKNMPFTREKLIDEIWGYDFFGETRVIDDLVKRLRKKLKDISSIVEISTVWGYGYRVDG